MPLGVLLKNENIIEDMASIMESLQNYVPHVRKTTSVPVPGKSGEYEQVHHDFFQHILFGGDQLTKVRAEGAQRMRSNSPEDIDKLIGLVPVIEDWHAKQCLAGVRRIPFTMPNILFCILLGVLEATVSQKL